MSVAAPKNTLLYQLRGRPLALKRSLVDAPITGVAAKIREFSDKHGEKHHPETEAIQFYLANHAMKELAFAFDIEEPLPDWAMGIANQYHETAATIAARAFYYLVLITAREARHDHNTAGTLAKAKAKGMSTGALKALADFPPDSASIPTVTGVFDKYPGKVSLGDLARSVQFCFYNGQFSGGYGGKKWGNVADCLVNYVTGEWTAETMLDTVWTLVHNGGPIFNKQMLYRTQDNAALQQVLDIQRAGMIPRMVLAPHGAGKVTAEKFINTGAQAFAKMVAQHLPGSADFKPIPVDFAEVQKLGAVGNYKHLIAQLGGTAPATNEGGYYSPAAKKLKAGVGIGGGISSDLSAIGAVPATAVSDKTHFVIAKHTGFMFKKINREDLDK